MPDIAITASAIAARDRRSLPLPVIDTMPSSFASCVGRQQLHVPCLVGKPSISTSFRQVLPDVAVYAASAKRHYL
jgi:hypothetical protein